LFEAIFKEDVLATRYLAKYFHHSSTGASHQLLLILKEDSSAMCIFEDMATRDRYRCEDFITWPDAIPLYRQEIVRLTDAGFFETVETNYTLSKLPAVPTSKPTWQQGLDELYLARLGNDTAGADDMIAVLSVTEAAATPFFLWLKAEHLFATVVNQDYTPALETCLAAEHGFNVPLVTLGERLPGDDLLAAARTLLLHRRSRRLIGCYR
jgi:hypothetical protein